MHFFSALKHKNLQKGLRIPDRENEIPSIVIEKTFYFSEKVNILNT